jgi:hypothetical protein
MRVCKCTCIYASIKVVQMKPIQSTNSAERVSFEQRSYKLTKLD